mgnify:CR=1 FL=1
MVGYGHIRAISAIRSFTSFVFSASDRLGSSVSTSATYVSVYSVVSSQLICTMARCILIPRKYFGLRAIETVALNVMTPLMFGMVALRT